MTDDDETPAVGRRRSDLIQYVDTDGLACSEGRYWELLRAQGHAKSAEEDPTVIAAERVADVWVSTIWLGIDHRFGSAGPPLVFETMVFGGPLDGEQWRWSTPDEARAAHARAVAKVRAIAEGVTS